MSWFWPILNAKQLPSRDVFLMDLELILKGTVTSREAQFDLFQKQEVPEEHRAFIKDFGLVNVDDLCEKVERLQIVKDVADQVRFHHWELRFAEVFAVKGGYDLILGNPPWVKIAWQKEYIVSEFEPLIQVRNYSATKTEEVVIEIAQVPETKKMILQNYQETTGLKSFLNTKANFEHLMGLQPNLYKCFISKGWEIGQENGINGFVHEAELLSDAKGVLKREVYKRLVTFWHFMNELKLFPEVLHTKKFACSISMCQPKLRVEFEIIANLFHPKTIDESMSHDGRGSIPGIKTADNKWEINGHINRVVRINIDVLQMIHDIFEGDGVDLLDSRIVFIHSTEVIDVLNALVVRNLKIGDVNYESTVMFDETLDQKARVITECPNIPSNSSETILSGPHIYSANPVYQTIPAEYKNKQYYEIQDLSNIKSDFLPRTLYKIGKGSAKSFAGIDQYRVITRRMSYPMAERSLVSAIIPPQMKHIHGLRSMAFSRIEDLINFASVTNSILYDFLAWFKKG